MIINIKQNDTKAELTDTLTLNAEPVNLADADVVFLMKGDGVAIRRDAEVMLPAEQTDLTKKGRVKYRLGAEVTDVEQAGKFAQEWEVTFGDGQILTFPNDDYNVINILADLG